MPSIALLLVLILVANGAPVVARKLLRARFDTPVDGGRILADGHPLLGASKTWRGLVSSVLLTAIASWLLGYGGLLGALTATAAMAGDLLSSFIKRRMGIEPSGRAAGLDQVPESLLPVLATAPLLHTGPREWLIVVLLFLMLEPVLSRMLYRLHIRKRPY